MIKKLFPISLLVLILLACLLASGCVSSDKAILNYADNFRANLDREADAWNSFNSTYPASNLDTQEGIAAFQKALPDLKKTFSGFLSAYESPYPNEAPQDLKDAVGLARDGTTKIVAGFESIDSGLTSVSYNQLDSGGTALDDGIALMGQAGDKYNSFVDTFNTRTSSGGISIGLGIVIGTGLLWLLGFFVVRPLTKMLINRQLAPQPAYGDLVQDENGLSQKAESLFTKTYIMVDVGVMAAAGLLMGLITGWYFIGLSWKARDWPGLIVFIGLSFLGSYIHG